MFSHKEWTFPSEEQGGQILSRRELDFPSENKEDCMLGCLKEKKYNEIMIYFMDIVIWQQEAGWCEVLRKNRFKSEVCNVMIVNCINKMVELISEGLYPKNFDMAIDMVSDECVVKDQNNIETYRLVRQLCSYIFYEEYEEFIQLIQYCSTEVKVYSDMNFINVIPEAI